MQLKILFIKFENVRAINFSGWTELESPLTHTPEAPIEDQNSLNIFTDTSRPAPTYTAQLEFAELRAKESCHLMGLNQAVGTNAIFFVLNSEKNAGACNRDIWSDLQSWLHDINQHVAYQNTKIYFLLTSKENPTLKERIFKSLKNFIPDIRAEDLIFHTHPSQANLVESIHVKNNPIGSVLKKDFLTPQEPSFVDSVSSFYHSALSIIPTPMSTDFKWNLTWKNGIELFVYMFLFFIGTLSIVSLLGGVIGAATTWIEIIPQTFTGFIDFNLFLQALADVFLGAGTPWAIGVVATAIVSASLIVFLVTMYGVYHFSQKNNLENLTSALQDEKLRSNNNDIRVYHGSRYADIFENATKSEPDSQTLLKLIDEGYGTIDAYNK